MTVAKTCIRVALAASVTGAVLCWSGEFGSTELFSQAHAIVGRPLTPVSYAGVARRTTRRTVYAGTAAVAAAPVATPVATPVVVVPARPACTTVVDAYGRAATVCR